MKNCNFRSFYLAQKKKNVLVLFASAEFPTRKTITSYLKAFRLYSNHRVFFNNDFYFKHPFWLRLVKFDAIVFHHSITTPWHRERYQKKIGRWKSWFGYIPNKIALFQDEYRNSELLSQFINTVGIQSVLSVAPPSEWSKIYSEVDPHKVKFLQILTGYIDAADVPSSPLPGSQRRSIDIGYRTDWTPQLYILGQFGYLKKEIAERFLELGPLLEPISMDVAAGRGAFLKGKKWFHFLNQCRFVLGVESGSSLLDPSGKIQSQVNQYLCEKPNASFSEVKAHCFANSDHNLELKAISPRHFEAIVHGCGQILVEGHYNGILKPWIHYLPIKPDFSNLKDLIPLIKDESVRKKMVHRAFEDIALNPTYRYKSLIEQVFSQIEFTSNEKSQNSFLLICISAFQSYANLMATTVSGGISLFTNVKRSLSPRS